LRPIPPPSGVWEVLADVTLTVDSDFVDFTGLDINADGAYRLIGSIRNPTASETEVKLYVNADYTDTNYYNQLVGGSGTTVYASRTNSARVFNIFAGQNHIIDILIVLSPGGLTIADSIGNRGDGGSMIIWAVVYQHVVAQANVTQMRLAATVSGALGANSRFILARVKRP